MTRIAINIRAAYDHRRWVVAVAVFVMAVVYLVVCMNRNLNMYDERLILFGAARVLDGDVPHRDFCIPYGPGQIYALAALYKVFGTSILVERAWDTMVRGCIVALVFVVVDQAGPRWLALLAAAPVLVCLVFLGSYGYPVFPALAASLAGLAFLAPSLAKPRPGMGLVAAGACAGLATLFRYDVGLAVFGSECAIVLLRAVSPSPGSARDVRSAMRMTGLFAVGFSIVVVPIVAAFCRSGAIRDLIFQIVTLQARIYVRMRGLPFPVPWKPFNELTEFAIYLPLLVTASAVPAMIALARRRNGRVVAPETVGPPPALPWTLVTLVVLTIVFFVKGSVRVGLSGMSMALVASLALAAVLVQSIPGRGRLGRGMIAVSLVAIFPFVLRGIYQELVMARDNAVWAADTASWVPSAGGGNPRLGSCSMPPGLERMACFRIAPVAIRTVRLVQHWPGPEDSVFVGLARHDKIVANDVLLYFMMNRRSATKWHQYDPGLQTSAPIQREMVDELKHVQPKVVVLESNWDDPPEPNDRATSSGVTLLDDYIGGAFRPVATFGANTVLVARSLAPP